MEQVCVASCWPHPEQSVHFIFKVLEAHTAVRAKPNRCDAAVEEKAGDGASAGVSAQ